MFLVKKPRCGGVNVIFTIVKNFFISHVAYRRSLGILLAFVIPILEIEQGAYGQASSPITSSGLKTQVSGPVNLPDGLVQHNITGGTRPNGGANLFHSFGDFGVPINNIANFQNDSELPTANILGRVTGGHPSNLLGTIQTEGFGSANLFLMNPAGIVFGPNATLNVGGAAHFTTADYLRIGERVQFTALPSAQDALLNIAPVAAFGFLAANPALISVGGSTLSISNGQAISLVGGDITIGSGLIAPGGQIALASVASPGEMLVDSFANVQNINGQSFTTLGKVSLADGTILDVSGDAAGTVIIRGGRLEMTGSRISADTENENGRASAVDIQVAGDILINATQANPAITARTTGGGNAGLVKIASEKNMEVTAIGVTDNFSLIDTSTSGMGTGGHVDINISGNLRVTGPPPAASPFFLFFIDSGTKGFEENQAGDIMIRAENIQLKDIFISSGDFFSRFALGDDSAFGAGGNITLFADNRIQLTGSTIATDGFNAKSGDLTLSAADIQLSNFSQLSLLEFDGGGGLTISASKFVADNSQIDLETVDGQGTGVSWPGVTINAEIVELRNGSVIRSQSVGDGSAGDIHVTASDHILFSDDPLANGTALRPSGLYTNSLGDLDLGLGDQGQAGSISIETGKLEISGGARINSSTQNSGRGGNITVTSTDSLSLTGQRALPFNESALFGVGSTLPSGIYSRSVGSEPNSCTGPCGDAGNIFITTGFLSVADGSAINSGTTSTGKGGIIDINASNNISISGNLDDGTPGGVFSQTTGTDTGSGEGGAISLMAGQNLTLREGATVSASSSGPANAGNIELTATNTILLDGATVTTEAAQASGGDIKLTAQDLIRLNDSTISSSVQGNAMSGGGNISIDPEFIILQNSQILAKAVEGQGGNISLVATNAVLADPLSVLDASSALGISGSVDIQAPIQNLSGTIAPLPEETTPVAALYGARCAAGQGGHFSTFVDTKADSLSSAPGKFLASPLLSPSADQAKIVATSEDPQSQVMLTASIAPLVLGYAGQPSTACP